MSKPIMLDCENLAKSFVQGRETLHVFENVSLTVREGETVAIVGASGSGKSSLLYLMGGLDKPSQGQVTIQGKDIHRLSEKQRGQVRNQSLGFVYQFHHLLPEFSAVENVAMPLLVGGADPKKAMAKAMSLLDRVGLSDRAKHKPGELSGGERQRTAIARALVNDPVCLLADEPTGNLDNKTAAQVFELLLELNQQSNTAIVMVTHDLQLAQQMEGQYELADGQLSVTAR